MTHKNQLREIATVLECYCGKEGQSDEFRRLSQAVQKVRPARPQPMKAPEA